MTNRVEGNAVEVASAALSVSRVLGSLGSHSVPTHSIPTASKSMM